MKVSGFTIVRNAIKYDYPVAESIRSILPIVDEMIVSVGNSDDHTLRLIEELQSPKIKIIQSVWDDALREGGKLLSIETNKALQATATDSDWRFYIQADEVLHEQYLDIVQKAMIEHANHAAVDGLLFDYTHFYGSYAYVANSPRWYQKEIRVIKNNPAICSWGDAQGFRKKTHSSMRKLHVKPVAARIYHYGWVKEPAAQQRKQETFHKMWHSDDWVNDNVVKADEYDYSIIDSLEPFTGTHPAVMQQRIGQRNWNFNFDTNRAKMRFKYRLRKWLKETWGISIGEYRNYKVV